ncbi:MAG: class I SAM-dependent methyltransferase [Corynebacterium sp.]|uniref:class I SAM-dependent methyltransferase n=1 Tax=Corynebacterium TaxID=1716 RepID=UPI0026480276|nr:class I SAM-dependent methyltransferase [Corynebacterium sp.]MDN6304502.1 class I SAM-dependent methyltransferase [Corynebacterium sp.]MDN6366299.1 class I SAM-dependent methyltransferase [Corynebacterium sp.]MDN6395095.1 class I SAM-dependent methyltransferase [Corynebacterium sp.]
MTTSDPASVPDVSIGQDTGPDTTGYIDYLTTNRDFVAPAVTAAIAAIDLPSRERPRRILDAGTGGGGALPELLRHLGPGIGSILAIDLDTRAVAIARDYADDSRVDVRIADLRAVAADATEHGGPFDLIWSSDVVWPATFDDPARVVAELAGALTPGAVLALFTTNYYQSMFLPGHSRLERLIRTASEITWGLPDDGPTHYERLGTWMRQAGLEDVTVQVMPLAAATSQPEARAYLETSVWPEMRHAVTTNGHAAGMTDGDIARAHALFDPDGPDWIGADLDGYVVHPTLLWTGRAPDPATTADRTDSELA